MQTEDARYIKRRVRSGNIDVHPTETALIVNYELEAVILGEHGEPILSDKKDCQKIIRLKRLDADTDCAALAKEVVAKCTLIHQSKLAEVEHLIYYLRSRKENAFTEIAETPRPYSGCESPSPGPTAAEKAAASFSQMEQYLELVYEELPDKIRGSAFILELAKDPNNLEELANSESVLSALSRVLREDWKKSIELSTNIVYIFFCFSTFSEFHPIVLQYKVGSLALEIVDYELKRYSELKSELETRSTASPPPISRLPLPRSGRRPQTGISSRVRTATPSPSPSPLSSTTDADKKRPSNIPTPRSALKAPSTPSITNNTTVSRTPESDDESVITGRKLFTLAKKQDQLLRVCFYLLLNIAENPRVEDKMRKRNLVSYLIHSLDRSTPELLVLVVTFLHKLSIYKENKEEMANMNVIDKLPKLLQMKEKNIELVTLKLLFNLSFDTKQREKMVRVGFIPKLVSLLGDDRLREVVLKLLYHLSMDDRVKQMFTYTDCVQKVISYVLDWDGEQPGYLVPVAVCVNAAINSRCAELMCDQDNLQRLMARAFHLQDSLLLKIVRNISTHQATKHLLIEFVGDLASVLTCCQNEDFLLECVGILANLDLPDLNYCQLLNQYSLIPWIKSQLVPGKAEVDLVLEVVMLVGTAAGDESCSSLLCKADILLSLIELLKAKQEDDEIVLQIIYVFHQVAKHSSTRDYLIRETEVPAYLIDLMHDKNEQIRKVCDSCLDIIKECNDEWADRIKTEKFEWHNSHWLSMVEMAENKEMDGSAGLGDLNEALPHFNILQQSLLFQTGSRVSLSTGDDIEIISNNPMSDDGSRPVSRYESDIEEYIDNRYNNINLDKDKDGNTTREMVRDALKNLVISEDSSDDVKFFHIDSMIE